MGKRGRVISSLRHREERREDQVHLLESLGRMWLCGVKVNWSDFYVGEKRHRVPAADVSI